MDGKKTNGLFVPIGFGEEKKKKIGAPLTISHAVRIAKIVDFLPNKVDAGFLIWAKKGFKTIKQMFEEETLKSFKQLQDKHGLCSKDFCRYLHVMSWQR